MDLKSLVNENQSIKIVPSIEDIVRQNGFDTVLDNDMTMRFSRLKVMWITWKKSVAIKNDLHELFNTVLDPFSVVLVMVMKCEDFKDCKVKSLPYCIVEELHEWQKNNNNFPENKVKLTAFHIATQQRSQDFLNLIVKTYIIKTEKTAILPLVQDMIKQGVYKQALQSVMSMEMFDDIPVQDLLFPLVLQDKGSMVDDYLMHCPHQAKPFALYIDRLLERNCSIKDIITNYITEHDIIDVKWSKLYYKPLGKLVARLCAKFEIPIENCKNLSKNRTTGGLRYLIVRKYLEKNVCDSGWNDLIKDTLEQSPDAAEEFVDMLVEFDQREALKWAKYLKIPPERYPSGLTDSNASSISEPLEEENWELEPGPSHEYYKLTLDKDKICIIDNIDKFHNLMESSLKTKNFVGIDCEWKPSFGATQSKVALIQIATTQNVYLIDSTVMNKLEFTSVWHTFLNYVLDNAEIIKVGFGLEHDLREMKSTLMGIGKLKMKGEGFLDLAVLWKSLLHAGIQFPHSSEGGGAGLSCLTQACFGLPLKKQEQCSNWEIRPLRSTQVEYAALDAYVLVEIYTFLQELCQKQNIKFDDICYDVMVERKQKNAKKNKTLKKIDTPINIEELNKSVDGVKFLVDPDLIYIIPYLRFCGIDASKIPETIQWHNVVNLAISEERFILLSKMKHTPTVNYPQDYIYQVPLVDAKQQLLQIIKHFHIKITPEGLFTRCVLCNSIELSAMSYNEVQEIHTAYNQYKSTPYSREEECGDDLDGFLSDSDEELYQAVQDERVVRNMWLTKTGVTMKIEEVSELPADFSDPITLCQGCGKLYWNGNHPLNDADNLINILPLC